jgi:hypothetical protein
MLKSSPEGFPVSTSQITLTEQDREKIGSAGGVSLTAHHLRRIERAIREYDSKAGAKPRTQKQVGSIAITLKKAIAQISAVEEQNPRAWRYVAQTWAAQDLDALKSLRGRCSRYGAVPKSLKFEFLPELMNKLAAVFEDADGGSTGVRRGKVPASGGVLENKRRGPFVEFAWEIVARLSADRRPNGKTALAAQWEEIRSSRKGTYAYMSVSDSFALVLRKKVIEQAKR